MTRPVRQGWRSLLVAYGITSTIEAIGVSPMLAYLPLRLREVGLPRPGTAFNPSEPHPALIWILFHVLQEYARHAGHLDVVRELADGTVGE